MAGHVYIASLLEQHPWIYQCNYCCDIHLFG